MLRSPSTSALTVVLLVASALGSPAAAAQPGSLDVAGTTGGAPTAALPLFGSTMAACELGDTPEPYDATAFATDTDGSHTVEVIEPIQTIPDTDDTVVLVYDGAFDPTDACAGFLGIGNETPRSGLALGLTAGDYVLVAAGFLGTEDAYTVRVLGPEGSTITSPQPPLACSLSAPLAFGDFDTDGDDVTYGEFVELRTASGSGVDLAGCSFATFDAATETVVYTTPATGTVTTNYVFASSNGDQTIPAASIPDGPGAFVLVTGTTTLGATVADVLPQVVAGLVYRAEDDVFARLDGGATAAQREAFGAAFSQPVTGEDAADGLDIALAAAPNPMQGRTAISFGVPEAGDVRLAVYDALGREVAVLADAPFATGRHELAFEARALPAGIYLVRLTMASGSDATLRVTRLR